MSHAPSSIAPSIKRLVVFDHGLGDLTGHWVNFHNAIARDAERRGLDVVIYGNKNINKDITKTLPINPIFRRRPWESISGDYIRDSHALNQSMREDFDHLDRYAVRPHDLLLFPTVTYNELEAVLGFIDYVGQIPGVRAAILFQFGETGGQLDPGSDSSYARRYREILQQPISPEVWDRIVFLAASEELSRQFSAMVRRSVSTLCMPCPSPIQGQARTQEEGLRVGYFGHASLEKGAALLRGVVFLAAEHRPSLRFLFHINPNIYSEAVLRAFDEPIPGVECARGHVSTDDYFRHLSSVDIVMMPYQREKYATTPSAVMGEALAADKVLVLPAGSWLSSVAEQIGAGAVCFTEHTEKGVAKALFEATDRFVELKARAAEAGERWRGRNNARIFLDGILAAID